MTDRQVKTYVSEADYRKLAAVADAADRSIANVMRLALRAYVDVEYERLVALDEITGQTEAAS